MAARNPRAAAWQSADDRSLGPQRGDVGTWTPAFTRRLGELGWIEGRNIAIEYRWSEGHAERVAALAAELVQRKVDVIVTNGTSVPALVRATSAIPIVFAMADDPVGSGLVANFAHPGGKSPGCRQSPSLGDYDKPQLSRCRTGEARGRGQCPCGWPRCRAVRCSEDGGYY